MNPQGHDGHFMYSGTIVRFVVPVNVKRGTLENPLSETEQIFLEERLGEDLNIHKKGLDNYWRRFEIVIRKDDALVSNGFTLDLSDPIDYIRYKVLSIQPNVAASWEERYDRGEYTFALVDTAQMVDTEAINVDRKKEAYLFLASIENSNDKMRDFLRVFGRVTSADATTGYLKTELDKIISTTNTLNRMLAIINDENYELRLFIEDAVDCGAIVKTGNKYSLPGGDYINPVSPNLEGTLSMLKKLKKETDEIYLIIETQIKESR